MKQVELTHTTLNAIAIFNNKSLYLIILQFNFTKVTAHLINVLSHFKSKEVTGSQHETFFFFNRSFAPVCIGETPMGSPYAHMSTPTGCSYQPRRGWYTLRYTNPSGLCTGPRRGPVKLRFSFRIRTVSLRLPGSLTTRRVVPDPVGVR